MASEESEGEDRPFTFGDSSPHFSGGGGEPRSVAGSQGQDFELAHIKQKDLHCLKFPALPENAGAYRQWRNSVIPMLSAFDKSHTGSVHEWYMKAIKARKESEIQELAMSFSAV